jgi:hypothetical protein
MKKILLIALVCFGTGIVLQAQTTAALKKIVELKMPKTEDDDMPGTRGAGVAWHPVQKKYYAVFAGNAEYPLALFDVKGKLLTEEDLTAMIDTRGIWYDPVSKTIAGNGYGEGGWFNYKINSAGVPSEYNVRIEGMNQPGEQSVGAYNAATKQVLFLSGDKLYVYDAKAQVKDSVEIHWGLKKGKDEDDIGSADDYNYTTVVYTGIKGQELGLLNTTLSQIELYDIKTGYLSKTLALPEDAVTEPSFNFAYTNGIYWLFDMEERTWIGYK